MAPRKGFDGMTFVAVVFFLFLGFNFIKDMGSDVTVAQGAEIARLEPPTDTLSMYGISEEEAAGGMANERPEPAGPEPEDVSEPSSDSDPADFAAPYKDYKITQGPHGFSYGHMAIDIAAGRGEKVFSPINGSVTELYVDEYGNPTLVIENEIFRVTMLHGDFTVNQGDQVELGQKVGTESNHGYTTDMQGNPCWGRNCGYHTHLNVYDKRAGTNVNPLDLIGR
jgi:murein DD-endopeptidase MepM/ murein hydrolase activator NlpD